jgi:hypothetical protein
MKPVAARGGSPGSGSGVLWLNSFAAGRCRPASGPFLCGVGRGLVKPARESAPVHWQPRGWKIGEGCRPTAKPADELVSCSTSRPKFKSRRGRWRATNRVHGFKADFRHG